MRQHLHPLPSPCFGDANTGPLNWRKAKPDPTMDDDSDEELVATPPDVVALLGFDPMKEAA